jgi:ankyrin repeat protein
MNATDLQLFEAARTGRTGEVRTLLQHGANPNIRDEKDAWTPLMMAALSGHWDVAKVLLKAGARLDILNCGDSSVLLYAVKSGDVNIVRQLLKAAKEQGLTAEQVALDGAMAEVLRKLKPLNEMRGALEDF